MWTLFPAMISRVEDLDVTARLSSVLVGGLPGSEVLGTWVLLSEGEAHYFTCWGYFTNWG